MADLLRKLKRGERPEARQATFKLRQPTDAEIKALGEKPDGYIAGWASTPDLDSYRDIVMPGAFQESISKRGIKGPKGIKFLIGHDWDKPAGAIQVLEYRGDSLWIEAQLNLNISYARDFYEASKSMEGLSFSVGFWLQEWTIKRDENDKEYFLLHKGDLFEVSGVPFPANEEAYMTFVKSATAPVMRSIFEQEPEEEDPYDNEEPPASLAEFEKRLMRMGLVQSRKDAKLITLEVKSAVQLFLKKEAPEEQPPGPETTEAPEAEAGIQKALDMLSSMKSIFASAN